MAIYINFLNQTLSFYSQNTEQLNKIKTLLKDYQSTKLDSQVGETEQDEEDFTENDQMIENDENVEKTDENEKINNSRNFVDNLNYDEDGCEDLKLENRVNLNLETFLSLFSEGEVTLSNELISVLKNEKQFLVLPDELVAFDYILMPTLSYFKIKPALNLKLGIEYKNLENYGKSFRLIRKTKANSMYAVQLTKLKNAKKLIDFVLKMGIKIKGINFYSGALAYYYMTHTRGSKNASIVVKISRTKTTILAIVHGMVVCMETLNCGEKEVYRNSTYKFDEYSRRSIAHKFVCYSVSQMLEGTKNSTLSRDQIEKSYSKTKTIALAGNFQSRNLNIIDLIHKKIDDMKMFLMQSEFQTNIENVFVDVKNDEVFSKLKLENATKVYYPESEIFKNQKTNKMFVMKVAPILTKKKGLGRSLWPRKNKKA